MPGDEQSRNNPAVDAAIAEYLELLERGAVPDQAAFLARHPEIANELRQFVDDYHSVKRAAAQRDDAAVITYSLNLDPHPTRSVPIDEIRYFGDYELLEEIERGGMGVVFKARQTTLNRLVAVKLILAGRLASKAEVDRFYAEAQAAAKLEHRNIVPIYEVGEDRGQHYYSMAYVPGSSLSRRLLVGPVPPREAAAIIRDAALAVHYAHVQGVIHRDLKPANILIDADGQPRVTDFGLAKQVSDGSGLTATGQVLGTPSFMPPEQVAQGNGEVGPASDVYSLGATLYALLVGRPPFQSASAVDTLKQVLEKAPVPLREFDASVPRDLETIVLKCLEKSPPRRYESAQALADELDRFLTGKPILARPVSRVERGWRWCSRNPVVAALSGAAASLLVAVAIVSTVAYFRVNAESREKTRALAAETDARKSEAAAKDIEKQQRLAAERQTRVADATRLAAQAREELDTHPQRSLLLAREAVLRTQTQGEPVVPVAEETLHIVTQRVGGIPLTGHTAPVRFSAFSSDGHYLATAGEDYTVRVWDLTKDDPSVGPRTLRTLPDEDHTTFTSVSGLQISNDSRWLKVIGKFGKGSTKELDGDNSYTWDLTSNDPRPANTDKVPATAFPTLTTWSVNVRRDEIEVHRIAPSKPESEQTSAEKASTEAERSLPAEGPKNPSIEVVKIHATGQLSRDIQSDPDRHWLLAKVTPDPRQPPYIPREMHLWDITAPDPGATMRVIATVTDGEKQLPRAEFSPDGRWLLLQRMKRPEGAAATLLLGASMETWPPKMVGEEHAMRLIDLHAAADAKPRIISAEQSIATAAFSPDCSWLATGHEDLSVRLWDLKSDAPEFDSIDLGRAHEQSFVALFSPKEKNNYVNLYLGGRTWMVKGRKNIADTGQWLDSSGTLVGTPLLSPGGIWVVEPHGREMLVWRTLHPSARPPLVFTGHEDDVDSVSFSSDRKWMLSKPTYARYEYPGITENQLARESASERATRLNLDLAPRLWHLEALGEDEFGVLAEFQPLESLIATRDGKWVIGGQFQRQSALLVDLQGPVKQSYVVDVTQKGVTRLSEVSDLKDHVIGGDGLPDSRRFNVALSPDEHWAAIGGQNKQIRLINLTADDLTKPYDEMRAKALSDKTRLAGGWKSSAIRSLWLNVWEPTEAVRFLDGHTDEIRALAFSPDGRTLASGSWDRTIRLWKMNSDNDPEPGTVLTGHHSAVGTLAFSPDGHWLATGSKDKTILVFDLHLKDPAKSPITLAGHRLEITSLGFSPDGKWLASGSADKTVRIWDFSAANSDHPSLLLSTEPRSVVRTVFSSNGQWFCAGASLWDCAQKDWMKKPAYRLSDNASGVAAIAFAPNSRVLAVAQSAGLSPYSNTRNTSSDGSIQLWRLKPGSGPVMPISLRGHTGGIVALAFSGNGKMLYSSSQDRTLREWMVSVDDLLAQARYAAGREFMSDERRIYDIPSSQTTASNAQQESAGSQLPLVDIDQRRRRGDPEQRFTLQWNMMEVHGRVKKLPALEFIEAGHTESTTYSQVALAVPIHFRDALTFLHDGHTHVYARDVPPGRMEAQCRPKAIVTAELEPDPKEANHDEYGIPVISYHYLSLAAGKARLRLLDEKTVWEIDAEAPLWKSTGIRLDAAEFAKLSSSSFRERFLDHLSIFRRDARGETIKISKSSQPRGFYSDAALGVVNGTGVEYGNGADVTNAYLAIEMRKKEDGNVECFMAQLRGSADEEWAELDGKEICHLPAITDKNSTTIPVRIEHL